MSEPATWQSTSAWSVTRGRCGMPKGATGVRLRLVDDMSLSTIILRQGRLEALATVVQEHLGCDLPSTGRAVFGPRIGIVWSAPNQWLVVGHTAAFGKACADLVAITDQSSSRAVIEVSGPSARDALAKGFAIDLHPSVFTTGTTAVAAVAHMSVQIWQADDQPRFVIAVPRSLAGSFWSWLDHACAAYGYEVAADSE